MSLIEISSCLFYIRLDMNKKLGYAQEKDSYINKELNLTECSI